jgi:anti-sigma factor (TIGR02949 family)
MDCRNIQRVIYEFLYGEADERKLLTIKAHLDKCKECEKEAEAIASLLRFIKSGAKQDPVPEGARDRMLKEIHRKATKVGNGVGGASDPDDDVI